MTRQPSRIEAERRCRVRHGAPLCLSLVLAFSLLFFSLRALPAFGQAPKPLKDILTGSQAGATDSSPTGKEGSTEDALARIEEKKQRAKERLRNAEEAEKNDGDLQYGVTADEFKKRTSSLRSLTRTYTKHIDLLRKLEVTRQLQRELRTQREAWQAFPETPPYSIDFVDSFRAQIHGKELENQALQVELGLFSNYIEGTREDLAVAEEELRSISESLEPGATDRQAVRARWLYETKQIGAQVLGAAIAQAVTANEVTEERLAFLKQERTFLDRKLLVAKASARFEQAELDAKLRDIDAKREALEQELTQADMAHVKAEEALQAVREALQAAKDSPVPEEREAASKLDETIRKLQFEVDACMAEAETARLTVQGLRLYLDTRTREATIWRERFDVYHSEDAAELEEAHAYIATQLARHTQWSSAIDSKLHATPSLISGMRQRLENWRPEEGDKKRAEEMLDAYIERDTQFRRGRMRLGEMEQLLWAWQDEIDERRETISLGERAKNIVDRVYDLITTAWNFTLFTVKEEMEYRDGQEVIRREGITVGEVILGALIVAVGIVIARRIAGRVRRVIIERLKVEEHIAVPVTRGVFYFLIFIIVLFALNTVQIPLTIFAYLGGAIAIGVGFGAQNLINNFISGLIIVLERPIKVGDIVELEGIRGRVIDIGARSSRVKRFDGIDILVPNSVFLEKNVTNLTLSDQVVRFSLSVGVAYGSPTREVANLIEKAATEHGKVLKRPEPIILFEDFGDSALLFTVYFWLELRSYMDYRIVTSDLRFRIDKLFREAGITIAFPQRDIHLDSSRPLRVEMVEPQEEEDNTPLPHEDRE